MLKRIAFVVAMAALLGGPFATAPARAAGSSADLTAMTNADRAAARLKGLSTASDLQSLAQSRANEMAKAGRIYHTPNLGSRVSGWRRLGENVGRGPELQDIETAFMNSPSHRENILDPGFTQLGVGVTFDGKEFLYVAVIFREPSGAAAASSTPPPTSPPATTPTTRAAAAPKPKPTTTTQAPTTTTQAPTTTTTTAPPPPPPVEEVVAPPVEPPPPVETTTTTAPRPIFTNRDFLAQNFSDRIQPVVSTSPVPVPQRSAVPIVLAAVMAASMGLLVGKAWGAQAARAGATPPPQ